MRDRGSVLILSMWILTLLALVSAGLAHALGAEARLAAARWEEIRLARAARSAVLLAAVELRSPSAARGRSDPALFKDRALPDGAFATFKRREDGRELYGVEDEAGRINLNAALEGGRARGDWSEVLEALFEGAPDALEALRDWHDRDDEPRFRGGAEKDDYAGGVLPRNSALESVEELLLVKGVTPELYERLKPRVTVHGAGRVNVNSAPEEVLLALGLEPGAARLLLSLRRGEDQLPGTQDDVQFEELRELIDAVQRAGGLSPEEGASIPWDLLDVKPGPFRLHFQVRLEPEGARRAFRVIVDGAGRVLSWREPSL